MEPNYELYDQVVRTTMINLYTFGKENEKIVLENFDYKNPAHLYVMEVARSMTWLDWPVYVEAPARFVRKTNKESKRMVIYQKPKPWSGVDVVELLKFMTNDEITMETYEEIYNSYYRG